MKLYGTSINMLVYSVAANPGIIKIIKIIMT